MSNVQRVADMSPAQLRSTIQSGVFVAMVGIVVVFAALGIGLKVLFFG